MTRADWYARNGGGWRKARKAHRCDRRDQYGPQCRGVILAGSKYFDTNMARQGSANPHATMRLCCACASGSLE
ncbi:hypothetical protein GCM10027081_18540 [Cupriavidus yeoncheonensis]